MITIRRADARGHTNFDWLDSHHTFSFGNYNAPEHMGFRSLRVINDDRVAGGGGFGMHGHRDMEILTYVLAGGLQHQDSLGNGETLRPGEFQRMTAGTGIRHSEFNASPNESVHFYQIWLLPRQPGLPPGYEQKAFPESGRAGRWQLVAAPDGRDGALTIQQDAQVSLATLQPQQTLTYPLSPSRHAWLQVLRGEVELNGQPLRAADGAALSNETSLSLRSLSPTEVMLFDLA